MTREDLTALRARLLFYYAKSKLGEQNSTSLSPPLLQKLLGLSVEPRTNDPRLGPILAQLKKGQIDSRWSGGRLVLTKDAGTNFSEEVGVVLEHWRRVTDQPRCLFSAERQRLVRSRLREGYTVEQLKQAATALSQSEHHRGQNDQRIKYLDVRYFAGSPERLDRWLGAGVAAPSAGASTWESASEAWNDCERLAKHIGFPIPNRPDPNYPLRVTFQDLSRAWPSLLVQHAQSASPPSDLLQRLVQ